MERTDNLFTTHQADTLTGRPKIVMHSENDRNKWQCQNDDDSATV